MIKTQTKSPNNQEQLLRIQRKLTDGIARTKTKTISREKMSPVFEEPALSRLSRLSYEAPWQVPLPADLHSMRKLSASLQNSFDTENVEHGLQFLTSACDDLPGEFFLQPPYIALVSFDYPFLANDFKYKRNIIL